MLGLSPSKILVTVAIIALVYYGWKWLNRVQARQAAENRKMKSETRRKPPPAVEAVDMIQCPVCGDYVQAKGAKSCGRDNCPYPG